MKGKVVIITGASTGIGKALAEEFASRGADLVIAARNSTLLKQNQEQLISDFQCNVISVPTDVSRETDCRNLVEKTIERFGRIDILINNAGISMRALFAETDIDVLRRLMDTNFWGTVYCTKFALPYLLKTKGSLVGVSSIAGFKGLPGRTGYTASKAAMQGFLDVIRMENMKKGLHVLLACPGFTTSNIRNVALTKDGSVQGETPLDEDKLMPAETVAKLIAVAVEKRKRTLILTTQGKMTVLLNKFFPSMMDRIVFNHMAREADSPLGQDRG